MRREWVVEIYQDVLNGKVKRFPNKFFSGEEGKKYVKYMTCYLLEERLSIPIDKIPVRVQANILWSHRLKPPAMIYGWNYYDVIENAYPGRFKPWEFQQVPHKYWHGKEGKNRAIEAVKHVIENELNIPIEEIPLHVNLHFFKKYHLYGVFDIFEQSPFQVIQAVYPGVFKPWQFANVPLNCWKDRVSIQETMDYFLFQQLCFSSYEEALVKIRKQHFFDFQLTGLLQRVFDSRMQKVREWIKISMKRGQKSIEEKGSSGSKIMQ
ncbi:DUF4046 domain-containing protein [Priestia filamentosa]|uniref:DUF4046 domain-containing protein n=1 Tax=Priestia filamentosa TaxID=1402861 RepID=UPI00289612B5|nr:DUF4046 domain-containing protein [Priestia filamentosa]MDT3766301.1 DUF4046 domain-containing protein [Priestia filamentosa]